MTPLRALIVDDSETDAQLVVRELRRDERSVSHQRVADAGGMREALVRATWDVVICDWSMAGFRTLDHRTEGYTLIGHDWRYLYLNDTAARQGRRRKEDFLGRTPMEVFPGFEQREALRGVPSLPGGANGRPLRERDISRRRDQGLFRIQHPACLDDFFHVVAHGVAGHELYLPRVDATADAARSLAPPVTLLGSETILLVEDEDPVRLVARGILQRHGYKVIEARNAGEALLMCEKRAEVIHLLVSDVVMPQMSGPELARRLVEIRPEMRVLCMSGYTDDNVVRHGVLEAEVAYLQKPITPLTLATKVREVLDALPSR